VKSKRNDKRRGARRKKEKNFGKDDIGKGKANSERQHLYAGKKRFHAEEKEKGTTDDRVGGLNNGARGGLKEKGERN